MTEITEYKGLGRKALDGAKYVGKNFWKVLPIGHEINFLSGKSKIKSGFVHLLATILWVCPLEVYILVGAKTGAWTPKQYKEAKLEKQEQIQYTKEINSSYNKLFENAANFEDSLKIYQENNLEKNIQFNEPSFKEKERVLEGRVE